MEVISHEWDYLNKGTLTCEGITRTHPYANQEIAPYPMPQGLQARYDAEALTTT